MELACAPSAVSNAASSFFGAPMFESSSVISDMPSSASVTDGTARRADASTAPSEPRLDCDICKIYNGSAQTAQVVQGKPSPRAVRPVERAAGG